LCVYVAPSIPSGDPAPASPAPTPVASTPAPIAPEPKKEPVKESPKEEPTKPSGPLATTTTLNIGPQEDCDNASYGSVSENYCYYVVSASVNTPSGNLVSPEVTFGFSNPGNTSQIGDSKRFPSISYRGFTGSRRGKSHWNIN
jgi:hypothetical protein